MDWKSMLYTILVGALPFLLIQIFGNSTPASILDHWHEILLYYLGVVLNPKAVEIVKNRLLGKE